MPYLLKKWKIVKNLHVQLPKHFLSMLTSKGLFFLNDTSEWCLLPTIHTPKRHHI